MHSVSIKTYVVVFIALMILLAVTVGVAFLDLGKFGIFVAIGIATVKACLILLFFMHLRDSTHLVLIFAALGVIWWGILLVVVVSDYLSRGWISGG